MKFVHYRTMFKVRYADQGSGPQISIVFMYLQFINTILAGCGQRSFGLHFAHGI